MSTSPPSPGKILVVDDDLLYRETVVAILRQEGYEVRSCTNGAEALHLSTLWQPEMVLMDVSMPVMDGFETCQAFKREPAFAGLPVIFMSTFDDIDSLTFGFDVGAADYIAKPIQKPDLLARVRVHLTARKSSLMQEGRVQRYVREAERELRAWLSEVKALALAAGEAERETGQHGDATHHTQLRHVATGLSEMGGRMEEFFRSRSGAAAFLSTFRRDTTDVEDLADLLRAWRAQAEQLGVVMTVGELPSRMLVGLTPEVTRKIVGDALASYLGRLPREASGKVELSPSESGGFVLEITASFPSQETINGGEGGIEDDTLCEHKMTRQYGVTVESKQWPDEAQLFVTLPEAVK